VSGPPSGREEETPSPAGAVCFLWETGRFRRKGERKETNGARRPVCLCWFLRDFALRLFGIPKYLCELLYMIAEEKAKNFSMIYSFCLKERFCWAVYRENTQKTKMPDICCLAKKRIKKARKIA
jgi:hypothetical protein